MMMEIMNSAPSFWASILDTQRCQTLVEFSAAIKYHEETLQRSTPFTSDTNIERRLRNLEQSLKFPGVNYDMRRRFQPQKARSNLIGWSPSLGKPQFPKDDSTVSKGKMPEQKGARPCRHCGSAKHWDYDCKNTRKGTKNARVHFASPDEEYLKAQNAYDDAYASCSSSDDEEKPLDEFVPQETASESSDESSPQQNACEALQVTTGIELGETSCSTDVNSQSRLRGSENFCV